MNAATLMDATKDQGTRPSDPNEWVKLYGDYLFHFAMGQVSNATEAEDLVQETFLAAIKSRDRFSGQSSERTWLVGILRHKICDYLRAKCRKQKIVQSGDVARLDTDALDESVVWLHDAASECIGPDRRMELNEFRASLELALGKLPARIAQVFEMYEMNEFSAKDVCQTMNISESNLWVMLHRARTQLRKGLAPVWGNGRIRSEEPSSRM